MGLIALASISCLQHISIFHVEGLTSNGLAAFLLACQTLTKVKLHACFESLIPQQILKYMEARGCALFWRDKTFEASGYVLLDISDLYFKLVMQELNHG